MQVKVVHLIHNMRATLLPSWHYRAVDPPLRFDHFTPIIVTIITIIIIIITIIIVTLDTPLRSDRFTPMENKVKLVQMLLSIVVNLSK